MPAGRLSVAECRAIADLADKYSAGEIRLTVEQNAMLPNVAQAELPALLAEPALNGASRMRVNPGNVVGHTVSCTGSQARTAPARQAPRRPAPSLSSAR